MASTVSTRPKIVKMGNVMKDIEDSKILPWYAVAANQDCVFNLSCF